MEHTLGRGPEGAKFNYSQADAHADQIISDPGADRNSRLQALKIFDAHLLETGGPKSLVHRYATGHYHAQRVAQMAVAEADPHGFGVAMTFVEAYERAIDLG
jgi:hypothetical protein